MVERVARCPRCKSEELSLAEVIESSGVTYPGRIVIRDGGVVPPSDFVYEPGNITKTLLICDGPTGCNHEWACRWPIAPESSTPPAEVCSTCGQPLDSPPCSLNRDLGWSGHTRAGGVAASDNSTSPGERSSS